VDIAPVRGDTKIPTLKGRSYSIRDLYEKGHEFGVWSCKSDGKVVAAKARAYQTQRDAPLVRVTLDNGEVVDCTPEHRFMLRDGSYLEADRLSQGASLMPFYTSVDKEGYLRICQNYSGAFVRAHWVVARSGLMGEIPNFEEQKTIIHHKNFDEVDNRPENLQFMGDKEHSRFHRLLIERNVHWQPEEFEKRRRAALSAKAATLEGHTEFAERARRMNEQIRADPTKQSRYVRTEKHRKIAREMGSRIFTCEVCGKSIKSRVGLAGHMRSHLTNGAYNHKVAAVERLTEREDVYCLDVPIYHNFALEAGVFVHICRMRLSVYKIPSEVLDERRDELAEVLLRNTNFGPGSKFKEGRRPEHEVLEDPAWEATSFLKGLKDTGRAQLGTSGSGNHFVEWGVFEPLGMVEDARAKEGVSEEGSERVFEPGRKYLALLSHSGSRGVGFKIANRYSKIAKEKHPRLEGSVADLAWLDLDSEEGEEYWLSMQLAGRFASANHAVIHEKISKALGEDVMAKVENHHNYAWIEEVGGREAIVHRKGATPAGRGVMGVIPGSMGDPGYVVRGKGEGRAINSASHGAGRLMSRSAAFKSIPEERWRNYLAERGITLIGGSVDEAPMAYKDIETVVGLQGDLVELVGRFTPKIVRMDAGGKPWGKKKRR
jgi:tRNA-splicing ligase RtcB (3'-phosphate/5'-hydroxy nucleic acid ligase)